MDTIAYPIQFASNALGITALRSREWLLSDCRGLYASQTLVGENTRRYHSLLTASVDSPSKRYVMLSGTTEQLVSGDHSSYLSEQRFKHGYYSDSYVQEVCVGDTVTTLFSIGENQIQKQVALDVHGTHVSYTLLAGGSNVTLILRPLVSMRSIHHLPRGEKDFCVTHPAAETVAIDTVSCPLTLYLTYPKGTVHADPTYYWDLYFAHEEERGYDYLEDTFSPISVTYELQLGVPVQFHASVTLLAPHVISKVFPPETSTYLRPLEILKKKSSQLLTLRDGHSTILAGYPWFVDWGRDTMISLPGLLLSQQKIEQAQSVLDLFIQNAQDGILPNCFADNQSPTHYNSVDATLWFAVASYLFADAKGSSDFIREKILPALLQAIDYYQSRKNDLLFVHENALLWSGSEHTQLTWMDAAINGKPVTPRYGFPVEVEALWYNFLKITACLSARFGMQDVAKQCEEKAELIRVTFNKLFYLEKECCLADCVRSDFVDAAIRPNVFIALSLPFPIVDHSIGKRIFSTCAQHCVSEAGVFSLSKYDNRFHGEYRGPQALRDNAYHQGTIWPWLTGPYATAAKRYGNKEEKQRATALIERQALSITELGIGSISELREGGSPHLPCGAPFQAWSVAETIRALETLESYL